MAITTIENISYKPFPSESGYNCYAKHGEISAGVLETVLEESVATKELSVALNKIQTKPEYRGIGIARTMVEGLVAWSEEKNAKSINGHIMASLLLHDTPDHVAECLRKIGFVVQGNNFSMKL